MISVQFLKFIVVGSINTLVGLTMIYVGKWGFGLGDMVANLLGYGIGIAVSFTLNARYTFYYEGNRYLAVVRFLTIAGLAYLLNLVTVATAIYGLDIDGDLAQLLGMPPYTVFSYFASKYWVFSGARVREDEIQSPS